MTRGYVGGVMVVLGGHQIYFGGGNRPKLFFFLAILVAFSASLLQIPNKIYIPRFYVTIGV